LSALSAIGVAANNAFGTTTVAVMDATTGKIIKKHWNLAESTAPAMQAAESLESVS
jgi:hypothetical protein